MIKINDVRVRYRILFGFLLMMLFILGIGILAILSGNQLGSYTEQLYRHPFTVSNTVRDINLNIVRMHRGMKDILLSKDDASMNQFVQEIDLYEKQVLSQFDIIYDRYLGDKLEVEQLHNLFKEWAFIRTKIIELKRQKKYAEAEAIHWKEASPHLQALELKVNDLTDFAGKKAELFMEETRIHRARTTWFFYIVLGSSLICGLLISLFTAKTITVPINILNTLANNIATGNLKNKIDLTRQDELGLLMQAFHDMQTQLSQRIEEDKRIANEALRINEALNNVMTGVLIVNNDYSIIYANKSVKKFFNQYERGIKANVSSFNASQIIGTSVDVLFHGNSQYQRDVLDKLRHTHSITIVIGQRTVSLNINPVMNSSNERLGWIIEWRDRTEEVEIEEEINNVVSAASQGEFDKRLSLEQKTGFFKALGESLNLVLDYNQRITDDLMRLFSAMAKGDLTQKITRSYAGSLQQLTDDVNLTITQLTQILAEIKLSVSTIKQATDEISRGNIDLSQRTEEHAASLEETSASMEEMTSTVQQNASNAQKAKQLASSAREAAQKGGEVVTNAISAMSMISNSSNKITDIISVIDEIAFQTNLLALNAAVEAARAGEQGRGFAVVATEVRSLAQRSAEAAKEIGALIKDSVNKVQEGTRLVNQSGQTLDEINLAVRQVSDIIAEISISSQEQAAGINQVNKAVAQMDEMTQQNAALVEESSVASEAMREQTLKLLEQVAFFKTE